MTSQKVPSVKRADISDIPHGIYSKYVKLSGDKERTVWTNTENVWRQLAMQTLAQ